ncbi:TIGR03862 family flavoprotein [Achromobacter piechaudii]|uniref:3-dehydro-bile acid delta(4,6)-reductase n=1 Tax=Achromobacter piechaudii TaxID=72556 RepID=A0ABN7F2S8_9BURK|nr:TIGR03862 family flavoprotein [Achromobacter piechaudii]CAB3720097.1 3-dehydro-bile acid delta(4,6)-reductase [Achromobacter piechaudii]CAB3890145.1 3-dehydro-bile acid delta(4,6)-reductase [Achromobacter piechaudii]CAB3951782.1 3-dehydro-bile acid delta(4,6)-reductase [Achromobacter piechaudii]
MTTSMDVAAPVPPRVAIIGGGPAGLMAAEGLAGKGVQVDVFDAMPSVGRKFLMAGRGGLNLTHSEAPAAFLARYGARADQVAPWLQAMDATALRAWAHGLGIETFVGSSGRVFPQEMKAAPLLRAWLARLRASGVHFHMRHRWLGWPQGDAVSPQTLSFETPDGVRTLAADAVVLALGGGSWAKLGSDGAWVAGLQAHGVDVAPLRPANCGFDVAWSPHFSERYAGQPVKSVSMSCAGMPARQGEFVVSASGIEGSLVYAMSAALRDEIETRGHAVAWLDLAPDWSQEKVNAAVTHPRGARSMSSHLQSRMGLTGVKAGLLRECASAEDFKDASRLAMRIKALPVTLLRPRPMDEAISTAGGVSFDALTAGLMLASAPGVFCAGEMLDWEAPTGGYLLTACMASGVVAANGVRQYLAGPR